MLGLLKSLLPRRLWTAARSIRTYARRIVVWNAVMRTMTGTSDAYQSLLARSFANRWNDARLLLDQWQDPILRDDIQVDVAGIGRFNLRAHSDDLYHVLPAREAAVLDAIRRGLAPGATFVDAGANIGFYTVLASKCVGPTGRVVAIEMMPDTAARLRDHVALNALPNVHLVEQALADVGGQRLEAHVREGKFGQASIVGAGDEGMRRISVETRTLDDLLSAVPGRITMMKMDLEGAEALALKGARAVLSRIDSIIFEQLEDDQTIAALLDAAGYAVRRLDGNNLIASRSG